MVPTGWQGKNCDVDINECADTTLCHNGATCENTNGSYNCLCVPGYTGSHCQVDINECLSLPCHNGGVCKDEVNNFRCDCSGTGMSVGQLSNFIVHPDVYVITHLLEFPNMKCSVLTHCFKINNNSDIFMDARTSRSTVQNQFYVYC